MINKSDLQQLEVKTSKIIKEAGKFIYESWEKFDLIKSALKDKRDVVTNIDVEAENMIREKLAHLLPEAGFIVEEGQNSPKEYSWVIDPIDGTKYFSSHTPLFVTQLALVKGLEPILGVIYNPMSQQLFSASLENGARLNNQILLEKTRTDPNTAILEWDGGGNFIKHPWKIPLHNALLKSFYRVRSFGAYSIYLTTGAFDAYVFLEQIKIVDIKPNIIIMKEAGLKVQTFKFNNHPVTVCSNQKLIDYIGELIINCHCEKSRLAG